MADPYGNYLANIGPFAGPGLAPLDLTREQAALYGMPKAPEAMDPGLSYLGGGIAGELGLESLLNMADLGHGIDPRYNSAGLDVGPKAAQALQAVGGAAMRGMAFAEPGAAGVVGGALTRDPEAIARMFQGREMAKQGASPQQIWQQTQTWNGPTTPEGLPRYWISDAGSSITPSAIDQIVNRSGSGYGGVVKAPLGEILNHPEAYAAYPSLADMPTMISQEPYGRFRGEYYPPTYEKIAAYGSPERIAGERGLHSILLHEMSHAIQHREGFAPGANYTFDPNYKLSAGEVEARLAQKLMGWTDEKIRNYSPFAIMESDVPLSQRWVGAR
jgi:hypothetical protein